MKKMVLLFFMYCVTGLAFGVIDDPHTCPEDDRCKKEKHSAGENCPYHPD